MTFVFACFTPFVPGRYLLVPTVGFLLLLRLGSSLGHFLPNNRHWMVLRNSEVNCCTARIDGPSGM